MSLPTVAFIAGGGTIGSIVNDHGVRCAGKNHLDLISQLQQRFPQVCRQLTIGSSLFAYGGLSENITPRLQQKFKSQIVSALQDGYTSIVVTHGTDSLEHTVHYLCRQIGALVASSSARVIFTAANRDISHPQTDAWDNLYIALTTAINSSIPFGIYVAFHGQVIPGVDVVKEPYNGRDMNYQDRHHLPPPPALPPIVSSNLTFELVNRVDLVLDPQKYINKKVVIFQLYHSGTALTRGKNSIAKLIRHLTRAGVLCLAVTENGEPVNLAGYETGVELRRAGLIPLPGSINLPQAISLVDKILQVCT